MRIRPASSFTLLCLTVLMTLPLSANQDLKPFPTAEDGYERFVIRLPKKEKESDLRVALVVGKTLKLDSVNQYFFAGKGERKSIPGWGYSYYYVKEIGPMAGTRVAIPANTPKVDRFIKMQGDWWLNYNSKLPVVVIVPKGFEVRYQIWKPSDTKKAQRE